MVLPLRVEGEVTLTFPGGGTLTGRVLAASGRELLLSWKELGGVLALKAFAMGPKRMVALDFNAWDLDAARADEVAEVLGGALERLTGQVAAPQG